MIRHKFYCFALAAASFLLITLLSCNSNPDQIPFPEKELGYSQPVTVPLRFSAEKKLHWDTAKQGGIKPVIKKLDLDALPSTPYDTNGFKPFTKAPEEVHFDFNSLPDTAFSLDNLPAKPLQFKTSVLAPSPFTKVLPAIAQKNNPLSIFDFGAAQNFPVKFITCLLKDKSGLMWIANAEGLFRYDGGQIQTYLPPNPALIVGMAEDDNGRIWFIRAGNLGMIDTYKGTISYSGKISAPSNTLSKIIKDENGRMWISTTTAKEVIIIDPVTQTFKSLGRSTGLSDAAGARDITEDDNGNIWINTFSKGTNIINLKTNKIKYLEKENGLVKDTLEAITKDKAGQIWIGLKGGAVDAIDLKRGAIRHYNGSQGLNLNDAGAIFMSSDNKGRIWMGSGKGVHVLDAENGRNRFIGDKNGLYSNVVLFCTMDNNNRMWVPTVIWPTGELHIIEQNAESVHSLAETGINSMIEDTVGNLWVATPKGVTIINANRNRSRLLDKSNGLSNDIVQAFFKINGNIVVTTDGGYNIIDPIHKTIESAGKNEGLINDTIYSLLKDRSGNTWLTGPSNGVDLIDPVKKIIRHVDVAGGLNDNNIGDLKEDNDGRLWLGTFAGGVNVIDPVAGTVKYLNDQPGLKDKCSKTELLDKYGRMWIGTNKGIYVADIKKGTLTNITTKEGLTNNRILSLLEYKGSVVAGTSTGVTIITATPPGNSNGETGTSGKDLVATGWKITPLAGSESLIKINDSWATDCITSKGQYLWGDAGVTVINDIKAASDSSVTYITGMNVMTQPQSFVNNYGLKGNDTLWTADTFYVKGQKQSTFGYADANTLKWDSVSGPYNMPVNLRLPYYKNYLQFQFAQANSGRQDSTRYVYVLEGIDKTWSAVTTNTSTENYLNLPPGKYTFKVSSKGIYGKWSTPATFSFTILPPWYKTWWAYTLYALLAIGILRAYIAYRSRRLKKENRILEEKINLRTSQLQKSLEDLQATQAQLIQSEKMASLGELTAGIAHEIQNPLNFINNFSEVNTELIAEMKEEIEKGNLEEVKSLASDIAANEQKINHHGKRADGIVKGMLQHSRTGSRQKEATNINTLADEYLRLAYHGLRAKDKSFNATMKTDFDERIGNINVISQDVGRVILNLITNAFYAVTEKKKQQPAEKADYEPTVLISTKKINGKIEVRVKDNGNGIPQKVLDKIFQPFFTTKPTGQGTGLGLSLSYDIVKAHGGEIKVNTKENEGTEFKIILPI